MNVGLIAHHNDPLDPDSFYRGLGPFAQLSRTHGVRLVQSSAWHWGVVSQCDCVFMQKPWMPGHLTVAEICRDTNTPLWVDCDDHMLAWPEHDHYFHDITRCRANINRIFALANILTVSTEALANVFGKVGTVVPNAHNDRFWTFSEGKRDKVISWRGGSAHDADLAPVLPAIGRAAKEFPDWRWHFFGQTHWEIAKLIPRERCVCHAFNPDVLGYMMNFARTRPAIHFVALEDTPFNRCKSNIAWLEATHAGAVTLAPNFEEWRRPGIHNYRDPSDFEHQLRVLIQQNEADRRKDVAQSRKFIRQNLLLSQVNQMRLEVLRVIQAHKQFPGSLDVSESGEA